MTTPTANPIPSSSPLDLLFNAEKLDEVVNAVAPQYIDRFGIARLTAQGATDTIKAINPRGAWVTATAYASKDLVLVSSTWYVAVQSHTSAANFVADAAKWRVYQGVISGDLAASSGASLMGFMPTGIGAVATTVQDALDEFNHLPTGFFWADHGARVDRLADRVMMGGAVKHLGTNVTTHPDWLTIYQLAKGRTNGFLQSTQVGVLQDDTNGASNAFIAAARTSQLLDNYNAIGVIGIASANKPTGAGNAYAGYYEGYRDSGAIGGAYGVEIDTINYASVVSSDCYFQGSAQVIGLQLAAGGEYSPVGQSASTAAINIQNNGSSFQKGIIFGATSLSGCDGVTGTAVAIAMAKGHQLYWMSAAGEFTSRIESLATGTAVALSQTFANNAINYRNSAGKLIFQVSASATAVNNASIRGSVTNSPVQLIADGDDANIDLQLASKGTGNIWIGAYSAGAVSQSGYITVKDSFGVIRRLLVG